MALLLPLLGLWLAVAVQMFGDYGRTIAQVRRAILAGPARPLQVPVEDAN